jgi:hypothetical protein
VQREEQQLHTPTIKEELPWVAIFTLGAHTIKSFSLPGYLPCKHNMGKMFKNTALPIVVYWPIKTFNAQ